MNSVVNRGGASRPSRLPLVALAIVASIGSPGRLAAVQQPGEAGRELDAGRFEIVVGGRRVGTEVFAVRQVGSKIRAVGRLQVEVSEAPWWPYEVRLQTNKRYEPEIYELRFLDGPTQSVAGRRTENGILIRTATDEGERFKEYGTGPGTLILERGAPHHLVLLFRHLGESSSGIDGASLAVIVPRMNSVATATIRKTGQASLTIAGVDVATTKYQVSLDGRRMDVWVDSSDTVVRIEIPEEGWQATRTDGE